MPEQLEDVLVEGGAAVAPPEPPAAEPAPVSPPEPIPAEPSLEDLLAQFDQETASSTAPAPTSDPLETQEPAAPEVNGDVKFQEAYRQELWYQQERMALDEQCAKLQERLPDYLPPDYAKSELIAMSIQDPRLEVAWQARNHDPAAIRAELTRAETALRQMQCSRTSIRNSLPIRNTGCGSCRSPPTPRTFFGRLSGP
jgi:hypothetical protein